MSGKLQEIAEGLDEPFKGLLLRASKGGLNDPIFVSGPPVSGKTTKTRKYANALVETGVIRKNEVLTVMPGTDVFSAPLPHGFVWADQHPLRGRRVIILDEIEKHMGDKATIKFLLKQLKNPEYAIILVGDIDRMLKEAPPELIAKLPQAVEITPLTESQKEARKQIIDETKKIVFSAAWAGIKTFKPATGKAVPAPETASFVKKSRLKV